MAKITVRTVTRLQKFLAAIAGDGVAPNPITDKEKLLHNIAENVNNGCGSSGGVLVVTGTLSGSTTTLDKTWQEIHDAMLAGGAVLKLTQPDRVEAVTLASYDSKADEYVVMGCMDDVVYATSTASGYPSHTVNDELDFLQNA